MFSRSLVLLAALLSAGASFADPVVIQPSQQLPADLGLSTSFEMRGNLLLIASPDTNTIKVFKHKDRRHCHSGCWQLSGSIALPAGQFLRQHNDIAMTHDLMAVASFQGGAHIYHRNGDEFTFEQTVVGQPASAFGYAADIDDGRVVVTSTQAFNSSACAAFVYVRDASGVWVQEARLAPASMDVADQFGYSTGLAGRNLLVGASEGFYATAFRRNSDGWLETQRLSAWDTTYSYFGSSISVKGELAAIGAPTSGVLEGDGSGAIYLFRREDGEWVPDEKLKPAVVTDQQGLGNQVINQGERIFGLAYDGIYVFRRHRGMWKEAAKLEPNGRFNPESMAANEDTLIAATDTGIWLYDLSPLDCEP